MLLLKHSDCYKLDFAAKGEVTEINETYYRQGLNKWLMEEIMSHEDLQGIRRFMLATRDAHGLYAQFGFGPMTFTDRWMQIHKPDIYKKGA